MARVIKTPRRLVLVRLSSNSAGAAAEVRHEETTEMTFRIARSMHTPAVFLTGLLVGGAAMAVGAQSSRITGNNGINHVGIVVDNMDEAIATYGKTFGFNC